MSSSIFAYQRCSMKWLYVHVGDDVLIPSLIGLVTLPILILTFDFITLLLGILGQFFKKRVSSN